VSDATAAKRVYGGLGADERRARRRERLLEAGLDLLGDEGWQATTVTAVCERARLTPRYFYESFGDRDELLVAIFDAIVAEVAEQVQRTLSTSPPSMDATVRAAIGAWVNVSTDDPRKGRVAFVEALGSEALMRRRLDATRGFAKRLSDQGRAVYGVSPPDGAGLELAGSIVAGGLIETMIEWLEGGLARPAQEVVDGYTKLCAAALAAAVR
jgi:AcrR family transcriptional regulator